MTFDRPPQKDTRKATDSEQISPEEIRRRMDDPKDEIHAQIGRAVNSIFSSSKYRRDHALREDLIQDVSLKVWKNAEQFRAGNLFAWIYGIARNTFLSLNRSKKLKDMDSLDELVENDKSNTPESVLYIAENLDNQIFLDSIKKDLLPFEFSLLEMKFKEGLTFAEIATRLKMDSGVVTGKFYRLLARIQKKYRR